MSRRRGKTANTDSLSRWDDLEREALINNRTYERLRRELLTDHPGQFAVITSGKLRGVFNREEDALREAAKSKRQTIVAHLAERREPRVVELGWSLVGDSARRTSGARRRAGRDPG